MKTRITLALAVLALAVASLSGAAFYDGKANMDPLVRHAGATGERSTASAMAFMNDPCDPSLSCCYFIDPDPLGGIGWNGPGWYGVC